MTQTTHDTYDEHFYAGLTEGSLKSAMKVLPVLFSVYAPKKVADFGCGSGAWLAAAGKLGAEMLHGFEGAWQEHGRMVDQSIVLTTVDFEQGFKPGQRYDLAISVEVAEHLSERQARPFVEMLCRSSDVVMFSAAVPHQLGDDHRNEQWPSYWSRLFSEQGYDCYDIFRGNLWNDDDVHYWYRQNLLLYVNRNAPRAGLDFEKLRALERPILDVVHPRQYLSKISIKGSLVNIRNGVLGLLRKAET